MTIEETIENRLFAHVASLDLDGAAVEWPKPTGPVDPAAIYVRVQHHRNSNTRLFVKGSAPHLRQGILQLTVVSPLNAGETGGTELAGSIAEQCPADLDLYDGDVRVRVQSAPDVATPELSGVAWNTRVDVYYEAFA